MSSYLSIFLDSIYYKILSFFNINSNTPDYNIIYVIDEIYTENVSEYDIEIDKFILEYNDELIYEQL